MLWAKLCSRDARETTLIKTEPTVLLVDDSITVRELLSMTLIMQATMWSRLVTVRKLGKNSATVFPRHRLL